MLWLADFLWWLRFVSDARDDLERAEAAASWKVASAGVDGLLARPLFVVTVAGIGAGGLAVVAAGAGVEMGAGGVPESPFLSDDSSGFVVSASFLLPVVALSSSTITSFVAGVAMALSLTSEPVCSSVGFASGGCPAPSLGAAGSGVSAALPLGLLDADEGGLGLVPLLAALFVPLVFVLASGG